MKRTLTIAALLGASLFAYDRYVDLHIAEANRTALQATYGAEPSPLVKAAAPALPRPIPRPKPEVTLAQFMDSFVEE